MCSIYLICFLVVFSDISVLVQAKHFRARDEGQALDIVNVGVVATVHRSIVQPTGGQPEGTGTHSHSVHRQNITLLCR